jgi:ABC-type Fe3+ transport system permease subunit
VALAGIVPLLALAWREGRGTSMGSIFEWAGRAPANSLLASALAATILIAAALVAGHALARGRAGGAALDALSSLSFVTPAALLGVGLIGVWKRPSFGAIYGSTAILVIGFIARYGAVGIRACAVAFSQVPPTLEEAASTTGARYSRRMCGS